MSLFRRGEIWYASFTLPNGKRFKQSLGTKDKRQATELHDKLKAEAWRVSKLGEIPDITFEEACVRWLEEKAHKKCLPPRMFCFYNIRRNRLNYVTNISPAQAQGI